MIYYVEDDTNIRELALYALRQSGLAAEGFAEGAPFKAACANAVPDLVLLDIMLPGENGLALLEWLRMNPATATVPVMMLTALGTEFDTVRGLDAGADDYLAKPFGMMELVSRCNALLRRAARPSRATASVKTLTVGSITLHPDAYEVFVGDAPVDLTLKEFELLRIFAENPGRAFTRAQLLETVWEITYVGETRTVDTHIQTLRKKLNEALPGAGDIIQTVRGVGYKLLKEA